MQYIIQFRAEGLLWVRSLSHDKVYTSKKTADRVAARANRKWENSNDPLYYRVVVKKAKVKKK